MFSHRSFSLMTFATLIALSCATSDAQCYSNSYTTFYGPSTSYYGGGYSNYAPSGGTCCGNGSYTSFYGGSSYGNNPFAPLVPGPRFDLFAPFRMNRYRAAYAPYGNNCGCPSPCGDSGCATGNCGVTTNQPLKPTPDTPPTNNGNVPRTYDENDMPPMDDPAFRPSVPPDNGGLDDSFPGDLGTKSFKTPVEDETPANETNPIVPLDANPASLPADQFNFDIPKPITPRNSAQFVPTRHLEQKISWRSSPVVVPSRQQIAKSRPLVVRQTVRVLPSKPLTMVSDSRPVK